MEKPRTPRPSRPRRRLGFRGKALALAASAALLPIAAATLALAAPRIEAWVAPAVTAATAAASLILIVRLVSLLKQTRLVAAELRAVAAIAGVPDPTAASGDELAAMSADIGQLKAKLESVRHRLQNRHPVTGVSTREPLLAAVATDLKRAASGTLGVIRFAQLERLTAVDRAAADATLRAFAERLIQAMGPNRPLAQVDRDSFAVWFCDAAGPAGAGEALATLADVLSRSIGEGAKAVSPDVRIGAALYPDDGADGPTLLVKAHAALNKTSRGSQDRVAFFSDATSAEAQARFAMQEALRMAMGRGELALHYQPVIDLAAGRVIGAEALLRWRHPELGPIPPAQFIPVLEQSGLMDEVGPWILDTACADARSFETLGLAGFKVGVNLSPRQFNDPRLPAMVAEALKKAELKPQRLELELTEAALVEDLAHTQGVFEALTAVGVSLAIDDFGAGASSLGDLKSLPFGKLKIDRAFVTEVARRTDSQAICAALIELGRRLDIAVLAEGVETREEVDSLRVLGCQLFQGFFFARPLPADKFRRKITDPEWLALLASPVHRQLLDIGERLAG
jgi:EAL domain-containing protein (putative c-di-GMP-specific phosphodiesterase class I)/GGDEF domain-containing protein